MFESANGCSSPASSILANHRSMPSCPRWTRSSQLSPSRCRRTLGRSVNSWPSALALSASSIRSAAPGIQRATSSSSVTVTAPPPEPLACVSNDEPASTGRALQKIDSITSPGSCSCPSDPRPKRSLGPRLPALKATMKPCALRITDLAMPPSGHRPSRHEQLAGHVRIDVVVAHEGIDLAARQFLDR